MKYKKIEKLLNVSETEISSDNSVISEKMKDLFNMINVGDEQRIDEIKFKALEAYKDLLESGFSCDPKHASNFLETAARLLELALNAEKIKIDRKIENKKLKLAEEKLKLMQRKLELEEKNQGNYMEVNDSGVYVDRNELLKKLLDK